MFSSAKKGYKEGFAAAAKIFEDKLKLQADLLEKTVAEKDKLIAECQKHIKELESVVKN